MKVEIDKSGVDKRYILRCQFGTATVIVRAVSDEWIEVEIEVGRLRGIIEEWGPGDRKYVRVSECVFSVPG